MANKILPLRNVICFSFLLAFLVGLLATPPISCTAEEADMVVLNGKVYTVDKSFSIAEAFAVKGDKFIYVGSNEGARAYVGPDTLIIDLKGKTVLPGLMDSHIHFVSLGRRLYTRDLNLYWLSLEETQKRIKEAIETGQHIRPGGWLVGFGYNDALWPVPAHKSLLDAVAPNNPVWITRYCGHAGLANSLAMELAGIDKDGITPDPPGGHIVRDAEGKPTGVFIDTAMGLITRVIPPWPPLTEEEERHCLLLAQEAVAAVGLTCVHDASASGATVVNRFKALYEAGLLKIRVNDMLSYSMAKSLGRPQVLYDNHYFLISVKTVADGSLGGRGAALLEEYSDAPGYYGELRIDEETFAAQVADLLNLGFQQRTHAIGDRANRVVLNAYEKALKATGKKGEDVRLAIEHSQVLHPDDIPRFKELGIVASMQPVHATEDMLFAEARLGPERIKGAYAWRTLLDLGVVIASGSDCCVSPYNPFYGMHAAVTRQDRENNPPGGWYPEQCMTREEALRSYTNGGAYVMFAEDVLGSIEVGKLADFVVIDRDYMTIPAEDIWKIQVLMTVVGGEIVYTKLTLVDVDIKPRDYPNSINLKSKGVVPVAALTSDTFDASTINPETVKFAGAKPARWILVDIDSDGDLDMLFHFKTQDLALDKTSFWATLTGETNNGVSFQGSDAVNIVPK